MKGNLKKGMKSLMKKPRWDKGSSLWDQPTYLIEEYINMLEKKIINLSHELSASQRQLYIIEQKEKEKGGQKN